MMQEHEELRRAIKEEVGKDLADFTFTPAMRNRVLARLEKQPRSRLTWLYPASAAAALLLILGTTLGGQMKGNHQANESAKVQATASAPASESAKAPSDVATNTPDSASQSAPSSGGEKVPATGIQSVAPNNQVGTNRADAQATGPAPLAPMGPQSKLMGKGGMAVRPGSQGPQLAVLPGAQAVISIAQGNVAKLDATGATQWQVEIPAGKQPEQVMITPSGKIAVVADNTMLILSSDGAVLESLQVAEPIHRLVFGPDDRLAIVSDTAVYVRQVSGQPLVTVPEAEVRAAAFTPDGLLILASPAGLSAHDETGASRWQVARGERAPVTPDGKGIRPHDSVLISPDGTRILWNDQLVDQNGVKNATLTDSADGQIAVGSSILRWHGERLQALNWAGQESWHWDAPGTITGLFAGETDRLWVLVQTPDGAQLQGLQASSGRPSASAQPLGDMPTEGVAAGGQVFLRQNADVTLMHS